jgi:protein tyrosine/serine phosphatase
MNCCSSRTGWRALVIAILLLVAGAVVWHKLIRDHVIPRNFGIVEDGAIYRSGRLTSTALRKLHNEYELRTIVDLGAYEPDSEPDVAEASLAADLGMSRVRFSLIGDGTGDPNQFIEAVRLMADPANQPVLVHCAAGAQRTSTAVILYRHLVEGVPIHEAYPESFDFKHEPDNYHLLAYLADNIEAIRASWETGRPLVQDETGKWVLSPENDEKSRTAEKPNR